MSNFSLPQSIPRPRVFNTKVLDKFLQAPLVNQGWVLRQLHLYYQCKDQMYATWQSYTARFGLNVDMTVHQRILEIFVTTLDALTTNTEQEISEMLQGDAMGKQARAKFDRKKVVKDQLVSDRIASWMLTRFRR